MSGKTSKIIKIIIADDHAILREGIRLVLEREPDMEISASVSDGRKVVRACHENQPDIVLMDISMPSLNGIEATRQIIAESTQTRVICLSAHDDAQHITSAVQAGASGYLLKDCSSEELIRSIRLVISGKKYISPSIADVVIDTMNNCGDYKSGTIHSTLTPREREVLQLLAEGQVAKEIAAILHLSVKTINTHREHIMTKLDMHSVAELTKYALREGITE